MQSAYASMFIEIQSSLDITNGSHNHNVMMPKKKRK